MGDLMVANPKGGDLQEKAAQALRKCLDGDTEDGLTIFKSLVGAPASPKLGLHVHLLEQAGLADVAGKLRALVLSLGGNLAWKADLLHKGAAERELEEYAALLGAGLVNSRIVEGYVQALAALGRRDEIERLFDPELLLHCERTEDHGELAEAMLAIEDTMRFGKAQISHDMRHLDSLERSGLSMVDTLLARMRAVSEKYLNRWAASDHPFAKLVPKEFKLETWAMIAREQGFHERHIHPRGWATGVYYATALPRGSVGGELRIGGWSEASGPGWTETAIVPEPGLIVMMPSWYLHWTEPTQVSAPRISIAFDVRHRDVDAA